MNQTKIVIVLPSLAGGGAEKVLISFTENINYDSYYPFLILLNKFGPLRPKISNKNVINLNSFRLRHSLFKLYMEFCGKLKKFKAFPIQFRKIPEAPPPILDDI